MYSCFVQRLVRLKTSCLLRFSSTMSSSIFTVTEHSIPTSHIREYPRALADDQEDVLQLAIKQYTPKSDAGSATNEVTIIGAHANGFPKVGSNMTFKISTSANVILGALRAIMGRVVRQIEEQRHTYSEHLDCRRSTRRTIRRFERRQTWE